MQLSLHFRALSLLLIACCAFGAPQRRNAVGATYFLTNDARENSIVIHDVLNDGTVKYSNSVSTGGRGASTNRGAVVSADALRTQGSVIVNNNKLFTVNPGSNSVAMFEINPKEPNQIKLVGKPVSSGGEFPASVAVSPKTGNVCVLNGGAVNGVQCFKPTSKGLVKIPNSNRLLQIPQTTPPTKNDTLNDFSTVLFSSDGSKLLIDVKGLIQQKVPGFLAAWDVMRDGSLSEKHQTYPTPSSIGTQNFGMGHLDGIEGYVVTDPTSGGIIYDFSKGYDKKPRVQSFTLPNQMLTCWVSYASKSDTYFMTDFGKQIVFEAKIDNRSLNVTTINSFQLPPSTMNIDNVVGTLGKNQYLYQLAPLGATLYVFDIQPAGKTKLIQSYNFTESLTDDRVEFTMYASQGLAFLAKN